MQIKISDISKTSLSLYRNDNDEFPILLRNCSLCVCLSVHNG